MFALSVARAKTPDTRALSVRVRGRPGRRAHLARHFRPRGLPRGDPRRRLSGRVERLRSQSSRRRRWADRRHHRGDPFHRPAPRPGRHRAWNQIRQHTLETIEAHTIRFAGCCALALGEILPPELLYSDNPSAAVKTAWVLGLAERIRAHEPESLPDERILEAARDDLGQVTGSLTQAVIALSSDTALIYSLTKLGQAANHVILLLLREQAKVPRIDRPDTNAWKAIADTLEAAASVLSYTTDDSPPLPERVSTQNSHQR